MSDLIIPISSANTQANGTVTNTADTKGSVSSYTGGYDDLFVAAKKRDIVSYNKFKSEMREHMKDWVGYWSDNFRVTYSSTVHAHNDAENLMNIASDFKGEYYTKIVDIEVKSTLLFGSKELEWMYKERTHKEEELVKQGISLLSSQSTALLGELLAKCEPSKALRLIDSELLKFNTDSSKESDCYPRLKLDKAFILLRSQGGREGAKILYKEVQELLVTNKYPSYILEMLNVLGNYLF